MGRLHLPVRAPQDVAPHLARGWRHWKPGYSAHALATTWFLASGFPPQVRLALQSSTPFSGTVLLDGFFERETDLRDGLGRPSQTDLLVLCRTATGELAVVAVEGKVEESFGDLIGDQSRLSAGQRRRLAALCALLGTDASNVGDLRYQLFHRAAAAVFEADAYGARHALLLVHSFSSQATGRADFDQFFSRAGFGEADGVRGPVRVLGVDLYAVWVSDVPPPSDPLAVSPAATEA